MSDFDTVCLCHLTSLVHQHLGQEGAGMEIVDNKPLTMIGTIFEEDIESEN